mgnify:CR=1 FL=1
MCCRPEPPLGAKTAITSGSPSMTGLDACKAAGRAAWNSACLPTSRSWTRRMLVANSSPLKGLTKNSRAPAEIARFHAGEKKLIGFFVGAAMKETGGKANPKAVNEIFQRRLTT